jgi:hypothetical protein
METHGKRYKDEWMNEPQDHISPYQMYKKNTTNTRKIAEFSIARKPKVILTGQ